ncbi:hypothetical protein PBT90_09510 [Algoriphagus halophytocola]|uniref:Uncharacterized protein n=1 Tax=Algoriphagus halophytocola TaxID=2991499 RepID=A0ABY6MIM2_9BACT|nr:MULTISPECIES: hypothetical protein [unclassified Algoriphagus]UZD23625.1 hypothetical protein OM944_03840 [Algoriphagus sp. TR-M5]WBL44918.1 hypothetical protein PBT90_09510 [Algoriphagus sp. TR-M9]
MKTLFTVALAGALSFGAFAADASEDLKELSAVNTNFKKVNVTLKEGVGIARISILTPEGKYLNSRKVKVKDQNVVVPYDLANLPVGEYQIRIETEDEEIQYKVETKEQPNPAAALPLMAYGKIMNDHTIRLSVVGLLEPGVQVKVFSAITDKVIYQEKVDQPEGFAKNYSFNGIGADEIYMELTDAKGRMKTLHF